MDQLSKSVAALADPTRRKSLVRLTSHQATVGELAGPFPITLQTMSDHLEVLGEAGLITRSRIAHRRRREWDLPCSKSWNNGSRATPLCGRRTSTPCERLQENAVDG